jgi:tetratricopeptide (TPR) repeat protein
MKNTIYLVLTTILFIGCNNDLDKKEVENFIITHNSEKIGGESAIDNFVEDISDSLKIFNFSNGSVVTPEWAYNKNKVKGEWFYEDSLITDVKDIEILGEYASAFATTSGYINGVKCWESRYHAIVEKENGKLVFKKFSWINAATINASNSFVWPSTEVKGALKMYNKMRYAMTNFRNNDALAYSDSLISMDPNLAIAHLGRLQYLYMNNQDEELEELIVEITPKLETASFAERATINTYTRSNSRAEILQKFKSALIYASNDPLLRAWYSFYLEDTDDKIENLKIGLKRFPESSVLNNMMAYVLMSKDNFEDAEKHLKVYMTVHPDEPNAYDSMGDLMLAKGDTAKAIDMFMKSYDLSRNLITGEEEFFNVSKEKADKLKH